MPNLESKTRFSDRVENYIRYRPGYPPGVIELMETACALRPDSIVADIGSGSGKLSQMLLEHGNTVYAVEPNYEMRRACERLLNTYKNFHSLNGSAERTELPDDSVDHIVCAQAFHWFNHRQARREFSRILKPGGDYCNTILIWNDRVMGEEGFMAEYDAFLCLFSKDYQEVSQRFMNEKNISELYGDSGYKMARFPNEQMFDWEGLKGRYLSTSYAFNESDVLYQDALDALKLVYAKHEKDGLVKMEYETRVFYGRLEG